MVLVRVLMNVIKWLKMSKPVRMKVMTPKARTSFQRANLGT